MMGEPMIDEQQQRRRFMRWCLLRALHNAQTLGASEEHLLVIAQGIYPDATRQEARAHLDYLEKRELIQVKKQPNGHWHAEIQRYGIDICEYEVDCDAGIARPPKIV